MAEDLLCIEKDEHAVFSKMSEGFLLFYSIIAMDSTAKVNA
jgi:hypothetical protein